MKISVLTTSRRCSSLSRLTRIESNIETLEPRRLLSVTFGSAQLLDGFTIEPYAVVDMNGDNKPDIVGVGENDQGIEIFLNQGNGTFGTPIVVPNSTSAGPSGLAIGDFNGDGVPDIAVMSGNDTVSCFLGVGSNIGGSTLSFLGPVVSSYAVTSGDVSPQSVIQPADTSTSTINAVTSTSQLQTAHFGGTMDDLFVDDAGNANLGQVLLATGGGNFQTDTANILAGPGDDEIHLDNRFVIADFNGDGISDIAYDSVVGDSFGIVVQFGAVGGTFLTSQYPYAVPNGGSINLLAATLTSPNGLPDLICNDEDSSNVDVLLNNGGGSFGTATAYPVTDSQFISVGDFDDSGSLDISAGNQILFNTGAGTFSPAQTIDSMVADDRISADLNGDGYADLLEFGPNVQIEGASSSGGGGTTGGGGGTTSTSGFSGDLTGSAPSSTIAGQKAKISQKLTVTASSAVSDSVTGALYLSSNGTVDSNSILLKSQTKKVKLKADDHITFNLKATSIPSSTPNGTYQLIAQITDSTGTTDVTGSPITVAPAEIDLSGAFSKQPVPGKNGKTKLSAIVTNHGNTAAVGSLSISIDRSPDGQLDDATVLGVPSEKINVEPGASKKIGGTVTLPAGTYFLVIQLDPDNAFNDVNLANNVFATTAAITVG
ncbi:MAG TPA: VCBS repeat-containing protein [Tepidisphaeraceae bacterium]|jgi:hypothetical protein